MPRIPTYRDTILADRPLVYYRLDETSGTTAADIGGHTINGVYTNSPTLNSGGALTPSGDTNAAVSLNGTSQYIAVASHGTLNALESSWEVSAEAWIFPTATRGTAAAGIISRDFLGGTTSGEEIRFVLGYGQLVNSDGATVVPSNRVWFGKYRGDPYNDAWVAAYDNADATLNQWAHYVGVHRAGVMKLYRNGTLTSAASAF